MNLRILSIFSVYAIIIHIFQLDFHGYSYYKIELTVCFKVI